MKVLDLQCALGHTFEGWFASEQDFVAQCAQLQIQCPLCGDPSITKKLSAPRLNLTAKREQPLAVAKSCEHKEAPQKEVENKDVGNQEVIGPDQLAHPTQALAAAWMAVARQVVANTADVGNQFAEEARKMHYGEVPERGIRGKATAQETRELVEEGIAVMPLLLPESLKGRLQ